MKIGRLARSAQSSEPTFEIEMLDGDLNVVGRRPAKHAGEIMALVEAQGLALAAEAAATFRVVEEEKILFVVTRDEHRTITTA